MHLAATHLDSLVERIHQSLEPLPPPLPPGVQPYLLMTVGLPGTGKSTFARRLAHRIDAVVLESDALRWLLFAPPSFEAGENKLLFEAIHVCLRLLLQSGRSAILDATSLKESDRRPLCAIAAETGARLLIVRLTAPSRIVEERLRRRSVTAKVGDKPVAGIEVYRRMVETEDSLTRPYVRLVTADLEAYAATFERIVADCTPTPAYRAATGGRES